MGHALATSALHGWSGGWQNIANRPSIHEYARQSWNPFHQTNEPRWRSKCHGVRYWVTDRRGPLFLRSLLRTRYGGFIFGLVAESF